MGPKERRSTVLSREEEAACVAFRQLTLLPLSVKQRLPTRLDRYTKPIPKHPKNAPLFHFADDTRLP
jgi:hypothetical protein